MQKVFVIYDEKDKKFVKRNMENPEQGQSFTDDIKEAESVVYYMSSASKKNTECQANLKYAEENNIPVETVNLGGSGGTVIGIICLVAAIVAAFYMLVLKDVPDLTGFEVSEAASMLEAEKFSAQFEYDYSEYPLGYVVRQEQSGKWMPYLSFLPVKLTVSLGEETDLIAVPDITGDTLSAGVSKLAVSGFEKCKITIAKADGDEVGVIYEMVAPAGSKVSKSESFGFTVLAGAEALTFDINGQTISLPAEEGASAVINLLEGTANITEAYTEMSFEDAEYIYAKADEFYENRCEVFDKPVVISGEDLSAALFMQKTVFNDDVLIKADGPMVVYFDFDCVFNGHLYIESNMMQATDKTLTPTIITDAIISVEVLHGSEMVYYPYDMPVSFNGEIYEMSEDLSYKDLSELVSVAPNKFGYSEGEICGHVITQRYDRGEKIIENQITSYKMLF